MPKHLTFNFHLVPRFHELITDQKESCHRDYAIGTATKGEGQDKCREKCNTNAECKFYFFTLDTNGWCELYKACDKKRTTAISGSTFWKIGNS